MEFVQEGPERPYINTALLEDCKMLQESQHLWRCSDDASPVIVLAFTAGDEGDASSPGETIRFGDDFNDRVGISVALYDRVIILDLPLHVHVG